MTRDLVVIVPSRGRPEAAAELVDAFERTCTAHTSLLFALDNDDEDAQRYHDVINSRDPSPKVQAIVGVSPSRTMVEALNLGVEFAFHYFYPFALGFMGDDHRPRSRGWDSAYVAELYRLGTGLVYGNDELQSERLPTQVAMTADIPANLGFMAPPELHHLYVDNFWRDLGRRAACISYMPEVTVEHMHPVAGKSEWTPGHLRANSAATNQHDFTAYNVFVSSGRLAECVSIVTKLRDSG